MYSFSRRSSFESRRDRRIGDPGIVQPERLEADEWLEAGKALVRHLGLAEVKSGEIRQPFEVDEAGIRDGIAAKAEISDRSQLCQMHQPGVGHARLAERQTFELPERLEMDESRIAPPGCDRG